MSAGRPSLFLFAGLLTLAARLNADDRLETGLPVLRVFGAAELRADEPLHSLAEGADGRLYLGGTGHILEFDGQAHRLLAVPQAHSPIWNLALAGDDTLYVNYGFRAGVFPPAPLGRREFRAIDLPGPVPAAGAPPIHRLAAGADFACYAVGDTLGVWRGGSWQGAFRARPPGVSFWFFDEAGTVLFRQTGGPLEQWDHGQWRVVLDAGAARPEIWRAVRRQPDGRWRIVTESGRLFLSDATGRLDELPQAAAGFLRQQKIKSAVFAPDNSLMAATPQGLSWFDADGRFLCALDQTGGLPESTVSDLQPARASGWWLLSDKRLVRIEDTRAVTRFGPANGLLAAGVLALARHGETLFAATEHGVFALRPGDARKAQPAGFEAVPGLTGRCGALLVHEGGLLAAGPDGVYALQSGRFERVLPADSAVLALAASRHRPGSVFYSTARTVSLMRPQDGSWRMDGPAHAFDNARSLVETPGGVLLAGGTRGTLALATLRTPAELAAGQGAAAPSGFIATPRKPGETRSSVYVKQVVNNLAGRPSAAWWNGRAVVFTETGAFGLRAEAPGLEPLAWPALNDALRTHRLRLLAPAAADTAWLALSPTPGATGNLGWILRLAAGGGREALEEVPPAFVAPAGEILTLLAEDGPAGRILWLGGTTGLVRVELDRLTPSTPPPAPLLRPADALTVGPTRPPATLRIDFTTPWFQAGGGPAYQTRLDGLDDSWSGFSTETHRVLDRLPPGDFVFRVRARAPDGRIGPEATFAFTLPPPWWQTVWAWGLYGLAGAGVIAGLMRWRGRALRRRNEELTRIVTARTAELTEAKAAAEAASAAKSTFLAGMSHELRTPLNAILGFAQILRRDERLNDEQRQRLAVINRNGDHLLQMINEILDLSKIEAGRLTLNPRPADLARLLATVADTFAQRAADKGLAFRREFAPTLPAAVMVDDLKLRQVLINLLGNAVKFTEAGLVTFRVQPTPSGLRFEVSDSGIGIETGEQERIFEPFHQTAGRFAQLGTGLGLAISQRIVGLMGGAIRVESHHGRGSRFWFEIALPAVAAAAAPPPGLVAGYAGQRRRLLVVDDEPANRDVLRALLEPLGFAIEECPDGRACLAAFQRQTADAILLDLRMPGELDGYATARTLRALSGGGAPAIIAVSASVFEEDRQTALDAGCDAFVPKPFNEERLFAALGDCLDLQWILREPAAPADAAAPEALPAAVVEELRDFARRGDIKAFRERIRALETAHPEAAATLSHLDSLAAGFQLGRLRQELRTARSTPSRPPA